MAARSWLFVKELRSTWVQRRRRTALRIAGPSATRDEREFATEEELEDVLSSLAERLVSEGWICGTSITTEGGHHAGGILGSRLIGARNPIDENVIKGDTIERHYYCGACNYSWKETYEGERVQRPQRPSQPPKRNRSD